jgi:hypothetical protein
MTSGDRSSSGRRTRRSASSGRRTAASTPAAGQPAEERPAEERTADKPPAEYTVGRLPDHLERLRERLKRSHR